MSADADLYLRWLRLHDEDAFRALALAHADLVLDVALRVSGDRARAEDAVQEALLSLARDGSGRPAEVGVRAWLARRAISWGRNARASDAARARREREAGAGKEAGVEVADAETVEAVRAALARAPGEDAAVLALRYLHGMEYGELAAVLDVAEPTARVRVHRALAALRAAIGAREEDDERIGRVVGALPAAALGAPARAALAESVLAAARATPAGTAGAGGAGGAGVLGRALVAAAAVAVVAGGSVLLWRSRSEGDRAPSSVASAPTETGAQPTLAARPPAAGVASPPAGEASPEGLKEVRFGMALFGTKERIPFLQVALPSGNPRNFDPAVLEAAVAVKAGMTVGLTTQDPRSAVRSVEVRIPDPVPAELVGFVPSRDDPRLQTEVFRVTDATTGAALPRAVLDPGPAAPELHPIAADEQGRIRVSRAIAERIRPSWKDVGAAFVEPDHEARGYTGQFGRHASGEELVSWDATGERTIALPPLPTPVPRLRLRILDADGHPVAGTLLVMRLIAMMRMLFPPLLSRTDGDGRVEIAAPDVFALDVYDAAGIAGTYVIARKATGEGRERLLRLRKRGTVRLEVEGAPADAQLTVAAFLLEPESLDTEELTGYAWKKGVREPGWKAFSPAEPEAVLALSGEPRAFAIPILKGRITAVWVSWDGEKMREVRVSGDGPERVVMKWADLGPISPFEPDYERFSMTDEPEDAHPVPRPTPAKPKAK